MSLKKHAPENSSLSSFTAQTENSQITKKAISTQQISLQSSHSHHASKSSSISLSSSQSSQSSPSHLYNSTRHHNIVLPFQINIQSLIKHLLIKLQQNGISVIYKDEEEGEILVQRGSKKGCFQGLLDCLCICRKEGWPKGAITRSFQAVSILVKRQYIESRSRIKISPNCPQQKSSQNLRLFLEQLIQIIKKCSQNFKESQQQIKLTQINQESPLSMQIKSKEKAYEIFIGEQYQDKRYKTLFNTAVTKIKAEIRAVKKQLEFENSEEKLKELDRNKSQESTTNAAQNKGKKGKKTINVGTLVDLVISETNNIFQFCRQLNIVNPPQFHPDYALYSIEALICYNVFPQIFQLYKSQLRAHCQKFHENSELINKNLTQKQYFDYLQIRPKYRLPSSAQPYSLAINSLRQMQTSLTLRQILLCMQKTFSLIKVCCLYQHDGKIDITSMDDILPVMIYVVAKAQVCDFPVYVKLIDDYVRNKGVFQLEERVITTLFVATQDISKKVPKIQKN